MKDHFGKISILLAIIFFISPFEKESTLNDLVFFGSVIGFALAIYAVILRQYISGILGILLNSFSVLLILMMFGLMATITSLIGIASNEKVQDFIIKEAKDHIKESDFVKINSASSNDSSFNNLTYYHYAYGGCNVSLMYDFDNPVVWGNWWNYAKPENAITLKAFEKELTNKPMYDQINKNGATIWAKFITKEDLNSAEDLIAKKFKPSLTKEYPELNIKQIEDSIPLKSPKFNNSAEIYSFRAGIKPSPPEIVSFVDIKNQPCFLALGLYTNSEDTLRESFSEYMMRVRSLKVNYF